MANVLLADNTDSFVELEKFFLEGNGHRVDTARSGEEVFAQLETVQPDILLIDFNLSGIGGDEVCRRLRSSERWKSLPVIVVTSSGRDEEVRQCLEAGCDDYITKPISRRELIEKVQRVLGKVRRRTSERIALSLRVMIQSGEKRFLAHARDLSTTGIFIGTQNIFPIGTVLEMKLEIPGGKALPLLGIVKRIQEGAESGMGVYFIRHDPRGQKIIARLIGQKREEGAVEPAAAPAATNDARESSEEIARLKRRIADLESENREFAEQIINIEEVNNVLSNLYVASSRLHAVLDRSRVATIINEVVINFIGAEKFALLTLDQESGELRFETGEGFGDGEFPRISASEGIWREVVEEGRSSFSEDAVAEGSDDPLKPIAAIPLRIHEQPIGVLAIYRLFVHKESFNPLDYQLFSMLAEHAAGALFSSRIYEESERKQKTYRGFMDLLLK